MKKGIKVTAKSLPGILGWLTKVVQTHGSVRIQDFYTRSLRTANQLRVKAADSSYCNGKKLLASKPHIIPILQEIKMRDDHKDKKKLGLSTGVGQHFWAKGVLLMMGDSGSIFTIREDDIILFRGNRVILQTTHDQVTKEKNIKFLEFS